MVDAKRQVPKRGVISATTGRQRRKVLCWQEKRQLCCRLLLSRMSEREIRRWEGQWRTAVRQTLTATVRGRKRWDTRSWGEGMSWDCFFLLMCYHLTTR
ncbi:hypothetical protein BHE74_00028978 [Ensete ventricosum]|nr:hypothetical protein BHE74_00028978 [Ensete ventricosum]RZR79325.1 hypothetical protein BHM03_00005029 [Ensete ventricosum]